MQKRDVRRHGLIWALLLCLTATFAVAQTGSDKTSDDQQAAGQQRTAPEEKKDVVYTNKDLKERFGEEEQPSPDAIPVETPSEQTAETPPGAYTNEDLTERFGAEEEAAAETGEAAAEAETEAPAEAEPAAEPEQPALSPEERARLISEIDGELQRLEKRLLALENPLLAGTAPPTPEEQTEEKGLDNAERLRRTEQKIDELKGKIDDIRSESESPPDE
jgi:hypothetical protein